MKLPVIIGTNHNLFHTVLCALMYLMSYPYISFSGRPCMIQWASSLPQPPPSIIPNTQGKRMIQKLLWIASPNHIQSLTENTLSSAETLISLIKFLKFHQTVKSFIRQNCKENKRSRTPEQFLSFATSSICHMTYRGLFWPLFHHLTPAHSCPWAIWPHQLHSAAAASCLFQTDQETNTGNSIFYPSIPKTTGLMSCSLLATPFLCHVAGNLHLLRVCVVCTYTHCYMCCEHHINMQHHDQCVLASLLLPSISHSVPSLPISHRTHLRVLSLPAKPRWTFEWRVGWVQG